jgi:hypothetical protein
MARAGESALRNNQVREDGLVSHFTVTRVRALLLGIFLILVSQAALALPVFPGAVGFGTDTPAGRGGEVIHVTSLANSGAGSLREALTRDLPGNPPRVIVFDVSGIIQLTSHLIVEHPNTTIAGQTAPYPGIMLRGADLKVQASNVLVQHLSSRPSDDMPGPGLNQRSGFQAGVAATGTSIQDIVFDHVSVGWAPDQSFLVWSSGDTFVTNLTVSSSLMSEGLLFTDHPDPEPEHSTGPLFGAGAHNITMYRDISAFNNWRNPLVNTDATRVQIVNNFFYSPGTERARFNVDTSVADWTQTSSFHGNTYISHPTQTWAFVAKVGTLAGRTLELFHDDNHIYMTNQGIWYPTETQTKWDVVEIPMGTNLVQLSTEPTVFPALPVHPALKIEPFLVANAGARSAQRDPIDTRVITDIETRAPRGYDNGFVSDPEDQVGGYPTWILRSKPFQELGSDAGDSDADGYTNLEERLHEMAFRLEGDRRVARFDTFEDNEYASNWHIESAAFALGIVQADGSRWLQQGANNTDARAMRLKTYFYDTVVQATVKPLTFENDTRFVRVYARYRDKERNYHLLLRNNGRVEIRRQDGPTSQLLGTFASLPINTTDQYAVRLSVVGGTISARVENLTTHQVVTLDRTDTNPLPPGFAGTGTFFASARFDNFFAGPTGTATPQVLDDFDDGNATGWTATGGTWAVNSSRYRQSVATAGTLARSAWNTNVAGPNQSVQATIDPIQFTTTSFVSVHARYVDANTNYYVTLRNNGRFELKKIEGGTVMMAALWEPGQAYWEPDHPHFDPTKPHTLKIEVTGTADPRLVGYLDGVPLLELIDNSDTPIVAANKAAVGTYGASADFDDVVVSTP